MPNPFQQASQEDQIKYKNTKHRLMQRTKLGVENAREA
jgi:hypothetical protein